MPKSAKSAVSESQQKSGDEKRLMGSLGQDEKVETERPIDLRAILKLAGPKRAVSGYAFFVKKRLREIKNSLGENNMELTKTYFKSIGIEWKALG